MIVEITKKQFYIYIFYFIFWLIIFYISWIVWILETLLSIILYFLFFYFFHILIKKLRKKEYMNFYEFLNYFLYRLNFFIIIIIWLLWSFSYYYNEISPAPMPEITISNWSKTVVFQAMSHIWTNTFYDTIKQNLTEYKKNWFVYFFEWVQGWNEENTEKFNKALWIEFNEDLYKNFSKLYWVINQDNNVFLWLVNDLDFNVDLNLDEIVELYEIELDKWEDGEVKNEIPLDVNKQIIETLSNLNDKQLEILRYVNKSILNFIIKSEGLQDILTNNFTNVVLFDVILNKRNDVLANEIINSEYNKIYLTYWLLHFRWVLELLQENDSNWKIVWEKLFYPIK
jgi:hypothetical protein